MRYPKFEDINHKRLLISQATEESFKNYEDKKIFFKNRKPSFRFSKEEDSFVKEFYPLIGGIGCAEILGRRRGSIYSYAFNNNIKGNEFSTKVTPFSYSNFIELPNQNVAYILGILWADGTIGTKSQEEKGYNRVTLCIKDSDYREIKGIFDEEAKWTYTLRKSDKYEDYAVVAMSDKLLLTFLHEMDYHKKSTGITPHKVLDFLGEDLEHHFIRGFFDGDGCFFWKSTGYDKVVSMSSVKNQDWTFLERICKKINAKCRISRKDYNSEIIISNYAGIKRFCEYIYKNHGEAFFPRKKNKYIDCMKHYDKKISKMGSKYHGVSKYKEKWRMRITHPETKKIINRYFYDEKEAAIKYDELARGFHGKTARVNFL